MNNLKTRKKPIIGTWLNSGSTVIAEVLANNNLDFVCIDAEHSPVDINDVFKLTQAIRSASTNCIPIARVHGVDYSFVKRFLDAGIKGIICPLVNSKKDVETLINATKYPPTGKRGVGFCAANKYGLDLHDSFVKANDEIFIGIQIEHIDAVKNIDEILSVEGIDAVFIGPFDLSASMGITGDFENERFQEATATIRNACKKFNIISGIHVIKPQIQDLKIAIKDGYELIAYSLDITMINSLCEELTDYRKCII